MEKVLHTERCSKSQLINRSRAGQNMDVNAANAAPLHTRVDA